MLRLEHSREIKVLRLEHSRRIWGKEGIGTERKAFRDYFLFTSVRGGTSLTV